MATILLGAAIVVGVNWWSQRSSDRPSTAADRDRATEAGRERQGALPDGRQSAPANGGSSEPRHPPFLAVYGPDGKQSAALLALASTHDGRQHYCIPAGLLPPQEEFRTRDAEPLDFAVITWDRVGGVVLLVGPVLDPRSEQVSPLSLSDGSVLTQNMALTAISPAGRRWPGIHIEPHSRPLRADKRAPVGSVLVDDRGQAVAMMGRRSFLPLAALVAKQSRWRGTAVRLTQQEIRANDPRKVAEDVQGLLDSASTSLEKVASAIELLQRTQHLAHDHELVLRFDQLMRWAHHQRIRLLSAQDGAKALEHALASFRRFGGHHGIHADAVVLLLGHGDPSEALRMFQSLQMASAKHAAEIHGEVVRGAKDQLRRLIRQQRGATAVEFGRLAVRTLPRQADLRMLYATALLRAGDRSLARVEGLEAVRLEPGLRRRFDELRLDQVGAARRGGFGEVVIPFDPREKQIRTTGSIAGHKLSFVLDTGATYSTVPRRLAEQLGLMAGAQRVRVQTANGAVDTFRVTLPSLRIAGRLELKNVPATVLDLGGNLSGSALLGMDFLQNFDWSKRGGALRLSVPGKGHAKRR